MRMAIDNKFTTSPTLSRRLAERVTSARSVTKFEFIYSALLLLFDE